MATPPRFYFEGSYLTLGEAVALPETVRHHAITVRRLGVGDSLSIFNGDGQEQLLRIVALTKKHCEVSASAPAAGQAPHPKRVRLGIAMIAQLDWALQKATELGVADIHLLITERTQGMASAQLSKKMSHWQGVLIAAAEQCGRAELPRLYAPSPFVNFITDHPQSVLLSPFGSERFSDSLSDINSVIIGPEGGFSSNELNLCKNAGLAQMRLGHTILRAETAALATLSLLLIPAL